MGLAMRFVDLMEAWIIVDLLVLAVCITIVLIM
jgi:hypothetical protein